MTVGADDFQKSARIILILREQLNIRWIMIVDIFRVAVITVVCISDRSRLTAIVPFSAFPVHCSTMLIILNVLMAHIM